MKAKFEAIRSKVLNGDRLDHKECTWAGADLIISEKPVSGMKDKVVVVTRHAAELSGLIHALRDACAGRLDYLNKYYFFPHLGETAISYLQNSDDRKGLFLRVIDEAERMINQFSSILYFAYGSNMDEKQMAYRCPGAVPVEKAFADGYRFALDEAGVATILPEKGSTVEGILWEITPENQTALDRYEGISCNCYRREEIHVRSKNLNEKALVYISNRNTGARQERSGYMKKIIDAAHTHNFSADYIMELCSHYNHPIERT